MNADRYCPACRAKLDPAAPQGLCPRCLMQEVLPASAPSGSAETTPLGPGFVAPAVEQLATHFPQLEIIELLGQGGMGAVYKARQINLDRHVALKVLPTQYAQDPAFAERFTREARALARLSHSHIVTVFEFGQADGYYYLIMEFVDGVNLRQAMQAGSLSAAEALSIVPQICDALQYAHDEGVVHRDIKPENVLIDHRGRVKIADFGLAKLLGHTTRDVTLTGTHQVMGTMHYMAPEQIETPTDVDHRADIYSLGVVFYELLTGQLPLGRFAPPSEKSQVQQEIDNVVMRTLEREPQRRYQQASEIKTDVEAVLYRQLEQRKPARPAAAIPLAEVDRLADEAQFSDEAQFAEAQFAEAQFADEARPNTGLLLGGGTFVLVGLGLFVVGAVRGQAEYLWPGLGAMIAGATVIARAFSQHSRITRKEPTSPVAFVMGIGLIAVGLVILSYSLLENSWMVWIGLGCALGGAGCWMGAWQKATPQPPQTDPAWSPTPGKPPPQTPTGALTPQQLTEARQAVHAPAIGLILLGAFNALAVSGQVMSEEDWWGDDGLIFLLAPAGLFIFAGVKMQKLESYGLAKFASVFAMIPCHAAFCVGLFIGIWSLGKLDEPLIKSAFAEQDRGKIAGL